ncbi:alpha-galactosidase [Hydrogenoanaerobacterium saccharovorans]|uniref:Alpha-galactosidase n=1 Tax=Hydrogenoanaerobacterium saccharovorans TaxID=474960 RepID=A0A1H8E7C6_9FIRM|nr:alpha-galactosidase [Hydrogenoanaerobacterium saccharovorans]RPF41959.1 alpha-galactosidase [Hydrogenoanaerobacterium saccharovorans]SEN15405.1 alpha-galactosidase [Hydrogenoanaerobacterium saccharovorans]
MAIEFLNRQGIFHLATNNTSYVIKLWQNTYPMHVYWGERIANPNIDWHLETPYRRRERIQGGEVGSPQFTREYWPFEYPCYGTSDFRPPAYEIQTGNGRTLSDARYIEHHIYDGKTALQGLPHVYTEAGDKVQTLELTLYDAFADLTITLVYNVFEDYDAITRHTRFYSKSQNLFLNSALSVSVDFKNMPDEMIQLSGTALREKHLHRRKLDCGTTSVDSTRGISSHQQNPFLALVNENTTEDYGDAYGIGLVYSGNFTAAVHCDMHRSARVQMGINPFHFKWQLLAGESFTTPEAVLVYASHGLGEMSRRFHRLYRKRLCRGYYRDAVRPVLLNTWEAAYFNINHDTILKYAEKAKDVGVELLVVDDGWFGKRDDDTSSLGDWVINEKKFPGGFQVLAKDLNKLGLKLGIWVEPEMISPNSELYRQHPDWCIHADGYVRTQWRNQLVLDFSRDDVTDAMIEAISRVLDSADIYYVKWDCNRRLTECGSDALPADRQGEFYHRYVLNLYRFLETLTQRFPHILFENCASGGGRFDAGMMYYFPQTWVSDNSDAFARLKIQYGSSLCYPPIAITAHISDVPNEQLGRTTPLSFRQHVSQPFNLGYEMDLAKMDEIQLEQTCENIALYKQIRELVLNGEFYRLKSPYEGNETAWMLIAPDCSQATVWYYKALAQGEEAYLNVKLKGLNPNVRYYCKQTAQFYEGDVLMRVGLPIPWENGDFFSCMWQFKQVKE